MGHYVDGTYSPPVAQVLYQLWLFVDEILLVVDDTDCLFLPSLMILRVKEYYITFRLKRYRCIPSNYKIRLE